MTKKSPSKKSTAKKAPAKKKTAKKAPRKATKKTPKKAPTKTTVKGPKKVALLSTQREASPSPWPVVLIIIGAAVIIAALIYWVSMSADTSADEPLVPNSTIAASVNGEPIMMDTLNKQYAMLPEQYKAAYTPELVLEQLISEELIIQYGEKQGLEVTGEEVQEEIQGILTGDMTLEDLQANLDNFNMTFEEFERLIQRKLMIEKSMNALFETAPEVEDGAAREYYDANIDQFATQEQVKVRHILIASQRDNAAQFSKDLMGQLREDSSDFCQIVKEETDDAGSRDSCGEYTFPRGVMVPEFEEASFDMAPGDVTLVQTQFGYHIIEKLADIPAGTTSFADAKDSIQAQLVQDARNKYYASWIAAEQEASNIETFI